ncbi:hypothetical protein J6590_005695 [Homalodisca vitripennis]|nr:hypothetical protein J6590_005695 [Homalodisca vitripennis]
MRPLTQLAQTEHIDERSLRGSRRGVGRGCRCLSVPWEISPSAAPPSTFYGASEPASAPKTL